MTILKRFGLWTLILLACVAVLAVGAVLALNTNFAHRYLLRLITARIQDAVGSPVEVGNFSFHVIQLGGDLYNVKIDGAGPGGPVLFTADRASVRLGLHLFHGKKIDLNDVTLDHPVLHLAIDSKGNSNLARPEGSSSGSSPNVFDLAIGHFVANNGEIFYNDRSVPVKADAHNLNAKISYRVLSRAYDGTLSYQDASVQYGTLSPVTHNLEAAFSASASGLMLKSLAIQTGSSSLQAQGQVTNYADPTVTASYEAHVSARDVSRVFESIPVSNGEIDTKGTFGYKTAKNEPTINGLSISGNLNARSLDTLTPQIHATFRDLSGEYQLEQGNLQVRNVEAGALGGRVTGQLAISNLSGAAAARLTVSVQRVSLPSVQDALRAARDPNLRVSGHLDGSLQAIWQGRMKDLQLVSQSKIAGSITAGSVASQSVASQSDTSQAGRAPLSFPLNATAQVNYNAQTQTFAVHNAILRMPHSDLSVDGALGRNSNLKVFLKSDDLRELYSLALAFQPGSTDAGRDLGLSGAANFSGTVSGQLANPQISGALSGANLQIRNATVKSLRADLQVSPTTAVVRQGEISLSGQATANFDLSIPLHDWHLSSDQPMNVRLRADKVPVENLEKIADLSYPVSGLLSGNVNLAGTEESPSGQGNVTLSGATAWNQPIQNLTVNFQGSNDTLHSTIDLRTPAGSLNGTAGYNPKTREYEVQATSNNLQLDQIQYIQSHAGKLAGTVNASVQGRGSLNAPQLQTVVDGQLQIGNQKIDGVKAQVSLANQRSEFSLNCSISGAALQAHGAVELSGDYQATANVDSQTIQLGQILSAFLPNAHIGLHGQTELHGTLNGPLKDPSKLQAHIDVPSLNVGYGSIQLETVSAIRADYSQGILAVRGARLKGTGTDVQLDAAVPLQSAAALRATANGTVDLQILQIWQPDWHSSGQINLNIAAQGKPAHPEVKGTIGVSNAALSIENAPGMEKIKGELNVTNERIEVANLTGQVGGGNFEVHGFATYQPSVRYSLGMTARNVRFLYPDGVMSQLSANLNFTGQNSDSNLSGQVTINRLSLLQSFDLASFSSVFGGTSVASTGFEQNVKLNVAVLSSQTLEASTSQLSVQGTADLHLQGTLADPVVIGRTNITGGEFFFNGNRYQVQNATIAFANSVQTEPVLNLTATTTVNQFNLSVNLVGPLDKLRTTYTSDPPLSQVDVINLLITGHTTEQASNVSAQSVVASQVGGQVSNRLQKLTGVSSLTIDPQIGGNQGNAASQLAIQERVTKNLFFTFATDVTTTQGEVVQVEYQVTPKYSISAIRDQTGGYEIEIKSHKRF